MRAHRLVCRQKNANPKTASRRPFALSLAAFGLFTVLPGAARADSYLKPIGGDGGGQFVAPCPAGQNLTGFELRAGDDVDAIRPACVVARGPREIEPPALTTGTGLVSVPTTLGFAVPQVAPGWFGGPGGGIVRVVCPAATPIVIGMDVAAEGDDTVIVNNIHLFCGQAIPAVQAAAANPSAVFDGKRYREWPLPPLGNGQTKDSGAQRYGPQRCPAGEVAVGVHGRAGKWLDAIGLVCDAVRVTPRPEDPNAVHAIGRLNRDAPPSTLTVCEAARQARARNSPAAPGLEAQCDAVTPRVAFVGRVKGTAPSGPPISVCDAAAGARDRKSPAAPGLEAQCLALGGRVPPPPSSGGPSAYELAEKGALIAAADPLSAELRERQREGAMRRGFDIGMAATEGHTAWGPGKQKLLDSLLPTEQEGFKAAASFNLDRNRNAALAATGASIAESDPGVGQARKRETDVRYTLGFDIASGIFGDPALGAKGNTATGPGSLGIRDALSTAAQRGFNASVALHLARRY